MTGRGGRGAEAVRPGLEDEAGKLRLMVRIAITDRGALGPGKIQLLELIGQHGSIAGACAAMGISYRRAWQLLEGLKHAFRAPLVVTQHGGSSGGGAEVTPFGRDVIQRYRAIESAARDAVQADLERLEQDLKSPEPNASGDRPLRSVRS